MKIPLILLFFIPFLAHGQLRVATANPLSGEVLVISGEEQSRLEANHWLKENDLLLSKEGSLFQINLGSSSFESREDTSLQITSSQELELQNGCLIGTLKPETQIHKKEIHIFAEKASRGIICFSHQNLFVVTFDGELKLRTDNLEFGVSKEKYRSYSFESKSVSSERSLSPIQFQELQGRNPGTEMLNLLSKVPYGLSGKSISNNNAVLLEEMAQIDPSSRKFHFEKGEESTGGEFIDIKQGTILNPPFQSYYDPHSGLNYFIPAEKNPLPVKQISRPYFLRENFRQEVTGGVRGLFDPQRLDGRTP